MRPTLLHWCIAAALAANAVVYFMPDVLVSGGAPGGVPERAKGLRSLVLLEELEESERQAKVSDAGHITARTEPLQIAAAGAGAAAVPGQAPAESAGPASGIKFAGQRDNVPFPGAGEDSAVAAAGDMERPPENMVQAGDGRHLPQPATGQTSEPDRCWLAGPVDSERLAEQLNAEFAAAAIGMDLILQTVEAPSEHWVYLPTSGEQADVRRLARELRQEGFDNFPITNGELAGSLSLGLFRSEDRARALQARLQDQGYLAQLSIRARYRESAWAALDDGALDALGWPASEGAIAGFPDLQLRQRDCPANSP